jgi:hypothetical protein
MVMHPDGRRQDQARKRRASIQWAVFAGTRIGFALMTVSAGPFKLTSRLPGTRLLAQFLGMAAIEEELSSLMDGRKVNLRTASELSRYFRADVLRDVAVLYGA